MSSSFRAPVASFSACNAESRAALDAVFASPADEEGRTPSCLRIDYFVAEDNLLNILRNSGPYLYLLDESGVARTLGYADMPPDLARAFAHFVATSIADEELRGALESYPLPWEDNSFSKAAEGRWISLLLFPHGMGAVIQEYIPTWLSIRSARYFGKAASAALRSEVMSLFLPPEPAAHKRLALEADLMSMQNIAQAMLDVHCDDDVSITLEPIAPGDRL